MYMYIYMHTSDMQDMMMWGEPDLAVTEIELELWLSNMNFNSKCGSRESTSLFRLTGLCFASP